MKDLLEKITVQAFLAVFIISACFAMIAYADVSENQKTRMQDVVLVIVGFYFGSSHGSRQKSKQIEKLTDNK